MKIGVPKESFENETRVAITPDSAIKLKQLGHECFIETGAGIKAGFSDDLYIAADVQIIETKEDLFKEIDIVFKILPPSESEIDLIQKNHTLISLFYPSENKKLLEQCTAKQANIIAMDMVPRISRAQKMDVLSSMANIAGYRAVIEASNNFSNFFTGQITAAGKVPPAKVLVVGAGVAGLSAIGVATSLGAITYSFDVRPEVAEQVESMGAEFVYLDFKDESQDGANTGGYAAPSSPEFRKAQLAKFTEIAPDIDIVITTALIPGRDAPELWTEEMVKSMKHGSVIVDLAAEKGGNCKLTQKDKKIVTDNGVIIIGYTNFPAHMARQSSQLFSMNVFHMLSDLTPEKDGKIVHNMEDDVIRGATVSFQGEITFPPPPPKVAAISAAPKKAPIKELTREEKLAIEKQQFAIATKKQAGMLVIGALLLILVGSIAPASFMQHFVVFILACFIGFQVVWNVNHALHTPLMAITNAISGIVIIGSVLQMGSTSGLVLVLASISILIATINIVGGFTVTRRMLLMFNKS